MIIKKLEHSVLENISKIIGIMFTGSEIISLLNEAEISNTSLHSTKWRRLVENLIIKQKQDQCANNVLNFLQIAFSPSRHCINNANSYEDYRIQFNKVLSFAGYEINQKGKILEINKSHTISDAQERANKLKHKLEIRNAHRDIYKYCSAEIVAENYFHVVFKASKSIFDKIRSKTGLIKDGGDLIDEAFSFNSRIPYLALSSLRTETEQSEQKGFMNLIKGIYGTFRNPIGHEVKIKWDVKEEDALDILSIISLIHRKIDSSIEARKYIINKVV